MSLKQAAKPAPTVASRDPRPALILLIVLCFVFIVTYVGRLAERAQVNAEAARLEVRIERAKAHSAELDAQRVYVNSQAYLDQKARESLGLVQPGDEMIIVLPPTVGTAVAEPPVRSATTSLPTQLPIWQQWVALFVTPSP